VFKDILINKEKMVRKNQLIDPLQSIKGNPEVMVWNGLVDDYMPLGGVDTNTLYKQSIEFIYKTLLFRAWMQALIV
jgi:hypothetical protein